MLSLSKFAVFAALLTQTHATKDDKDNKEKKDEQTKKSGSDAEKAMTTLTKIKGDEKAKAIALFMSLVHEWASMGYLHAEYTEIYKVSTHLMEHLNILTKLKDVDNHGKIEALITKAATDRDTVIGYITRYHSSITDAKSKEGAVTVINQPIPALYGIADSESKDFIGKFDPLVTRFVEAARELVGSAADCMIGNCTDDALKLLKEIKAEAIGKGLGVDDGKKGKVADVISEIETSVKTIEDLAKKIKKGTKLSSLEAQLKKEIAAATALALGLGLGLGLGLPLAFALVLFILFKNGRLSWRSSSDSHCEP